jgi:hypothetical protein
MADRHLANKYLAYRHLANIYLADRHLANRHLADRHLADRHLTDRHLTYRHLANRHLADRHGRQTWPTDMADRHGRQTWPTDIWPTNTANNEIIHPNKSLKAWLAKWFSTKRHRAVFLCACRLFWCINCEEHFIYNFLKQFQLIQSPSGPDVIKLFTSLLYEFS